MSGEGSDQLAPANILPAPVSRHQRLGVVDDDEQTGLLHHFSKPGQKLGQTVIGRKQMRHLEAAHVALQCQREVGQRAVDGHALVRCLVPDQCLECVFVTVGQL